MSDTFILELPLRVNSKQRAIILKRLEAARQVYNACLGEFLRSYDSLKKSSLWETACQMPRGKKGGTPEQKAHHKARGMAFGKAKRAFSLTEYQAYAYTRQFNHSWLAHHLQSQINLRLAKRAFHAVERYMYGTDKPCKKQGRCTKKGKKKNCYLCGRPRFKVKRTPINSVEGTSNTQAIIWRDGQVIWSSSKGPKLKLPAILNVNDPVQRHGLACRVKYVRILRKAIGGRDLFYAQLVLEGTPLQRTEVAEGCIVGLDLGPSSIAVFDGTRAFLQEFCAEVEDRSREIRRARRQVDRQRRANNPDCYDEKGRAIKGMRPRNKSETMKKTEAQLAEIQRKLAAHRKTLQGQLVNTILAMGNVIQTEKLSYRAWQKRWGKSVLRHAPGTFMQILRQKTKSTGGQMREFSTYTTCLSQTDHKTGKKEKKSLSQRWHYFEDGTRVQRDLYSAFLAFCVNVDTDTLDVDLAQKAWSSGADSLLEAAFGDVIQLAKGGGIVPACFGLGQSQSQSASKLVQL